MQRDGTEAIDFVEAEAHGNRTHPPRDWPGGLQALGVARPATYAAKDSRDLSQVVVARTSSLSAAGTRRFSFNFTVRL